MPPCHTIASLKDRYDLFDRQARMCGDLWPQFMHYDPVAHTHWKRVIHTFPEYQLLLLEGTEILAVINTIPLHFEGSVFELPDDGWDWGVKKSISDNEEGLKPNCLMGLQIAVNKTRQGKGLGTMAVKEMSKLAMEKGFDKLILPVRPCEKHHYPLIPMGSYVKWENGHSLPFDKWLRVHVKSGGQIIKICSKSMCVKGTVEDWKKWTKVEFPGSGSYIIPGALNPITIDISRNEGIYFESNVWIVHTFATSA